MMLAGKPLDEWIAQYEQSHQHPLNRASHTVGIPMIALSLPLLGVAIFVRGLRPVAVGLFTLGWAFQFVGHYFEKKPPEFLRDWHFLLVGLRWWFAKVRGQV